MRVNFFFFYFFFTVFYLQTAISQIDVSLQDDEISAEEMEEIEIRKEILKELSERQAVLESMKKEQELKERMRELQTKQRKAKSVEELEYKKAILRKKINHERNRVEFKPKKNLPMAKGVILIFKSQPSKKQKALILKQLEKAGLKQDSILPRFKMWIYHWEQSISAVKVKRLCKSFSVFQSIQSCEPDSVLEPESSSSSGDSPQDIYQRRLKEAEKAVETVKQSLAGAKKNVSTAKEDVKKIQAYVETDKKRVKDAEIQVNQKRQKLDSANRKLKKTEQQANSKQVQRAKKRVKRLQRRLKKSEGWLETMKGQLLSSERELKKGQQWLKNAEKWLKNTELWLTEKKKELANLRANLPDNNDNEDNDDDNDNENNNNDNEDNDDDNDNENNNNDNEDNDDDNDNENNNNDNENNDDDSDNSREENLISCNIVSTNLKLNHFGKEKSPDKAGTLSDYWAQEIVGADLLKKKLAKAPLPSKQKFIEQFDLPGEKHDEQVRNLIANQGKAGVLPNLGDKLTTHHTMYASQFAKTVGTLLDKVDELCGSPGGNGQHSGGQR